MRIFCYILFCFCCLYVAGQNSQVSIKNIRFLKKPELFAENQVSIITKKNDSTNDITIYLVNRTKDSLTLFGGYESTIRFDKEILDKDGNWKPFDMLASNAYWCGTGLTSLRLYPETYTFEVYKNSDYRGNLESKIRFSYQLSDSVTITSNTINADVDENLLLRPMDRIIESFKSEILVNDTLDYRQKERIVLRLSSLSARKKNHRKAVALCTYWLKRFPNSNRVKLEQVINVYRYISFNKRNLTKIQMNTLLSFAIGLASTIPESAGIVHEKAMKYKNRLDQYLFTQPEWKNGVGSECFIENGIPYCYYKELLEEKIQILFKE